jgi:hypothetical protein
MQQNYDYAAKTRVLGILKTLLESPYTYTKSQLAERYNKHKDTIKGDFQLIKNAGFAVIYDNKYRYCVTSSGAKLFEKLNDLLFFSEKDRDFIFELIHRSGEKGRQPDRIMDKLRGIIDFTRLGSSLITNQFLAKVDILKKAKAERKAVRLVNYRSSNSKSVADRLVEPFEIMPKEDLLHALDLPSLKVRHFRIARFERVELLDTDWAHEKLHYVCTTDPFGIADEAQVVLRVIVDVAGRNELLDRFPATYSYIRPQAGGDGTTYELDCRVNQRFRGIANFILGNYNHVLEIKEPEALIDFIEAEAKKILGKF